MGMTLFFVYCSFSYLNSAQDKDRTVKVGKHNFSFVIILFFFAKTQNKKKKIKKKCTTFVSSRFTSDFLVDEFVQKGRELFILECSSLVFVVRVK